MILVLLALCIIMTVLGIIIIQSNYTLETLGAILSAVGLIGGIISLITTIVLTGCVISDSKLDAKIAMYSEENEVIEQQIAECVQRYQEYEHGIFSEVAPSDAVAIVAIYPDLKSDGLVQAQIDTYVANNNKIKCLKEKRIDASVTKWWLYFGS